MAKNSQTPDSNLKSSISLDQRPSFSDQSSFKKLEDKLEEEEGGQLDNTLGMMEQSFGNQDLFQQTSFDQSYQQIGDNYQPDAAPEIYLSNS